MESSMQYFVSSLSLEHHPMVHVKFKLKMLYYSALEYIVREAVPSVGTELRLKQYRERLLKHKAYLYKPEGNPEEVIISLIGSRSVKWRKKYRYMLLCDAALISLDEKKVRRAAGYLKKYLDNPDCKKIDDFLEELLVKRRLEEKYYFLKDLPGQYYKNMEFLERQEIKIVVTANMSAGKSTLINALIGKNAARTSQEACTGNLCYFLNKPFEDDHMHMDNGSAVLAASKEQIWSSGWQRPIYTSLYFRLFESGQSRIRIVDTPGVNSAVNRVHGEITKKALKTEDYDKVIYILNANKLGTDEEISYLKWMHENIPKEKMIFVINKLDDYKQADDSISESIAGVRKDLAELGYEDPMICPLSAYFGYLLKRKFYGAELTEDEEDEYMLFSRKFRRNMYDLSVYYDQASPDSSDDVMTEMGKRCGLYGLEKILFGGN